MDFKTLDIVLGVAAASLLYSLVKRNVRASGLPPGPKGLPIIGNILDLPKEHEWLKYAEWGRQYGDIISLKLLGQPIVILNSPRAAQHLLENNSLVSSDRPSLVFACEIVGWKDMLGMTQYGDRLKSMRRMVAKIIGTRSQLQTFHPAVEAETHQLLRRFLDDPERLIDHLRLTIGIIIIRITYGYQVKDPNDPILKLLFTSAHQFSSAAVPGAFAVDTFPILRYLPSWLPGGGFHKTAEIWKKTLFDTVEIPFRFVQEQLRAGTAEPSFAANNIEDAAGNPTDEEIVKFAAGSMYSAGADTTASQDLIFFLAMVLYPKVQAKAQVELDSVVGQDRLPTFSDRPNLPYIDAVVKEMLRWHPATPIGVAHKTSEDTVIDNYVIPKGSYIFPNQWQLLHDETMYSNPMEFNPDRFLGPRPERDPRDFCFGFARRSCPGLHMAETSIWSVVAMTLATFDIKKKKDEYGIEITPPAAFMSGVLSRPEPFPYELKPRSAKHVALIKAMTDFV